MDSLLQISVLSTQKTGLFVELPVDPEGVPFLVSGAAKRFLWVHSVRQDVVRSAIRSGPPEESLFSDVIREVLQQGRALGWGNSFPCNQKGLQGALGYLRFYGFDRLELLCSPGSFPDFEGEGITLTEASWVPPGSAVLVPEDRTYLGTLGLFKEAHTVVVHNPSRGMAILGSW